MDGYVLAIGSCLVQGDVFNSRVIAHLRPPTFILAIFAQSLEMVNIPFFKYTKLLTINVIYSFYETRFSFSLD